VLEVTRRFVLLVCLLGAIATALLPRGALLRVATVDMADRQSRKLFAGDLTLEEFIAQETKDRLVRVQGVEWEAFFASVSAAASGQAEDRVWAGRLGHGFCEDCLFFRPDEPPLSTVTGKLSLGNPFTYLALSQGGETEYLGVTYLAPRDALGSAPAAYLFPYRRYSLWLFLAGVLVYALLPRRKHPPEAIYYSKAHTGVLMDILGCLLAGVFFALPLWVIPASATDANLFSFSDGWAWMTLICWALAAGGVIVLISAARYASFEILIHPDRLLLATWRGREEYRFEEMTGAILAESSALGGRPDRVRKTGQVLAALLFLFSWRASATVAGLTSQRRQGLEILCRDGRTLRIWTEGLVGLKRLEQALRAAGVLMTEEAGALMQGKRVRKRPLSKSRRKKK